jgi:3-phosphoshikimate 1-carboxyvinyltransferase
VQVRAVEPLGGPFAATVAVPGSKSIANRALVCAALAEGTSHLTNLPDGDDTVAMAAGLRALGADVDVADASATISARPLARGAGAVDARLAGTTSRFLTAVAALGAGPSRIDGAAPLRRRPMGPLHDALRALGARVTPEGEPGRLPVTVEGPVGGGRVDLPGDVSSQFLTALMLIGPCLAGGVEVRLTTPLVSRPYVELTAAVMRAFGVAGVEVGARLVRVPPARYRAATLAVEADAASASYLAAAATIAPAGSVVHLPGLGAESIQPDAAFLAVLARMGAAVERREDATSVRCGDVLWGIDADLSGCSDAVPTLAVIAAVADGSTRIRGVEFVRAKESDRIGALAAELRRCGAAADEHDDGLTVHPRPLHGATIRTHHDHRLAMAFGVLGLRVPGIAVEDPTVVTKSFPGFWDALASVRRAVGSIPR